MTHVTEDLQVENPSSGIVMDDAWKKKFGIILNVKANISGGILATHELHNFGHGGGPNNRINLPTRTNSL